MTDSASIAAHSGEQYMMLTMVAAGLYLPLVRSPHQSHGLRIASTDRTVWRRHSR